MKNVSPGGPTLRGRRPSPCSIRATWTARPQAEPIRYHKDREATKTARHDWVSSIHCLLNSCFWRPGGILRKKIQCMWGYLRCLQNLLLFTFRFFRWPKRCLQNILLFTFRFFRWPKRFLQNLLLFTFRFFRWPKRCLQNILLFTFRFFRWLLTVQTVSPKIYCYFSHSDFSVGPNALQSLWARPVASLSLWLSMLHGLGLRPRCGGPHWDTF